MLHITVEVFMLVNFEQLVRRAASLLYFMEKEDAITLLREDIKEEALLFFVMKAAQIYAKDLG